VTNARPREQGAVTGSGTCSPQVEESWSIVGTIDFIDRLHSIDRCLQTKEIARACSYATLCSCLGAAVLHLGPPAPLRRIRPWAHDLASTATCDAPGNESMRVLQRLSLACLGK